MAAVRRQSDDTSVPPAGAEANEIVSSGPGAVVANTNSVPFHTQSTPSSSRVNSAAIASRSAQSCKARGPICCATPFTVIWKLASLVP